VPPPAEAVFFVVPINVKRIASVVKQVDSPARDRQLARACNFFPIQTFDADSRRGSRAQGILCLALREFKRPVGCFSLHWTFDDAHDGQWTFSSEDGMIADAVIIEIAIQRRIPTDTTRSVIACSSRQARLSSCDVENFRSFRDFRGFKGMLPTCSGGGWLARDLERRDQRRG
jgi:hypothetical protein